MKLDIVLLEFYVVERLKSSFFVDELNEIAFAIERVHTVKLLEVIF